MTIIDHNRNHSLEALINFLVTLIILIMGCAFTGTITAAEKGYILGPGDYERRITIDGMNRYYFIHVPPGYDRSRPTSVVLNFHGGGANPKTQRNTSQMDLGSDRFGFIAVYPQGTAEQKLWKLRRGYSWNAGTCCGWAQKNQIDDVGFTTALLDDLTKQFNTDSKRVYATGYSNGAIMCYRLACELSNRIAAIAPVAGPMGITKCNPSRPVSVMHFHGTGDKFAPFAGGRGSRSLPGQYFESVDKTIAFWLGLLKCDPKPSKEVKKGRAIGKYYGPGEDGAEVVLWTLQKAGHTWPGGKFGFIGKRVLGEMNTDISATELMWEFFQRHPIK